MNDDVLLMLKSFWADRRRRALALMLALVIVITLAAQRVWLVQAPAGIAPGPAESSQPLLGTPQPRDIPAEGALVMIQGLVDRRLVLWPIGSDGPGMEIDRHVGLWPLLVSPDGTRLLYATQRSLMVLDVAAGRASIVARIPEESTVALAQWSPDSTAVAYVVDGQDNSTTYVTSADGSQRARSMITVPSGLPVDVGWLADGRPVSIYIGIGPVGGLVARYQVFDPATGQRSDLAAGTEVIQPWAPWRSPDGTRQLYPLGQSSDVVRAGYCMTGQMGLAGDDWLYVTTVGSDKLAEVAFSVPLVFLDRPMWLDKRHVLMRGIAGSACSTTGMGLYVGDVTTGETRQLTISSPVLVTTDSSSLYYRLAYALSPDGRAVAWTDHDLTRQQSRITLTVLDGDQPSIPLYRTPTEPEDGQPFAFEDQRQILTFVWLPGPLPALTPAAET